MYGTDETRAFCCNCKDVTLHRYTMFASQKVQSPKDEGLIERVLSALFLSNQTNGDYKCSQCGTYLETPDYLD